MESGDSLILREYLVSLGFKVDAAAKQKFGEGLTKWDKAATKLGKSLVGVAVGAQVMATEFAFRMERLFYASKLAESAAGNLQALDFGGKQAGIKDFTANVLQFARAIRANPGLQGLLNSLGVKVEGRDKAEVLLDFVHALRSMPFYVAQRYASLFGIDPDELKLMEEGLEKIKAAAELRKQSARDLGIDTEQATKAGLEYAQQWREILMYVGLFRDGLSLALLGPMRELAAATKELLKDWIRITQERDAARGITEKGAAQSGLTVDEQKEMSRRIDQQPKRKGYYELTPEERKAQGMPESDDGKPWTVWDYLTPAERKSHDLPATEAEMPLGQRAWRAFTATSPFRNSNPNGAVEFSDTTKERLGGDRLKATSPSPARGLWDRMWSGIYQSRPKVPIDPAAIDAATEPAVRAGEQPVVVPGAPTSQLPAVSPKEMQKHPTEEAAMSAQEQAKGLPSGLLDYIWGKESARGQAMRSPAGAKGHFGFMDDTAKDMGLKDPDSFPDSMKAASSYMKTLMDKYNGDLRFALAAYNWGQGNLDKLMTKTMSEHGDWSQDQSDKFVLGHLPEETRKYIAGVGAGADSAAAEGNQVTINADMKINVHEATDGADVAQRIADNQKQVWGDVARQFSAKVR